MTLEFHSRIDALARDWEELADRAKATPFLRPDWFAAWRRAFGRGQLDIIALRRCGRLAAVLPMQRRLGALLSPSNYDTPVFGPIAEDRDALAELAQALYSGGRRRVSLTFVEARSPAAERCLEAATTARHRTRVDTVERSPYLVLDGDWDAYQRRLGGKRRSNLRRLRRRLEARGELSLEVSDGTEKLDDLLEEGYRLEASGWKGEAGTAIASQPRTRRFYTDVARWSAERGWLRLALLRLDGRALAFDYALEQDGVHYLLKTGYDSAFRTHAPGILLRHEMISRAFRVGLERYELLGVDAEWKREWADTERDMQLLEAFPRSSIGTASWLLWAYARPALNRARRLLHP